MSLLKIILQSEKLIIGREVWEKQYYHKKSGLVSPRNTQKNPEMGYLMGPSKELYH